MFGRKWKTPYDRGRAFNNESEPMNKHEADTKQFCALVAKGYPRLAMLHLFVRSGGFQWTVCAAAARLLGIPASVVALKHFLI